MRIHLPAKRLLRDLHCLAVVSFIAGLKLWPEKPEAVRFARSWLSTYLVVNFAYFAPVSAER